MTVTTKHRTTTGTLGGITEYTDTLIDGAWMGSILHTQRNGCPRFMAMSIRRPEKQKYFARLSTAVKYIVKQEKGIVSLSEVVRAFNKGEKP